MSPAPGSAPRAAAVVVAAGDGRRMGTAGERKPFLELLGRTVLERACAALAGARGVEALVLVARADEVERVQALARAGALPRVHAVVAGGAERSDSVRAGASRAGELGLPLLCVHDAARPLVSSAAVERVLEAAARERAAILAVAVRDTLWFSAGGARTERAVDRASLWAAQTPQAFESAGFQACLARAEREGFRPTDDAALWERYEGPVALVPGEATNLKITDPGDLALARAVLGSREEGR